MIDQKWLDSFREKLDNHYAWPSLYTFKFIVPKGKEEEVRKIFPMHTPSERASKNGNYTSFTVQTMMPSTDAVIDIYQNASDIDGIIAL
jgi:putative lipoic acid-binding regulatory protein